MDCYVYALLGHIACMLAFEIQPGTSCYALKQDSSFQLHTGFRSVFCPGNVAQVQTVRSRSDCGQWCSQVPGCFGFFFQSLNRKCGIGQKISVPDGTCHAQKGSNYYMMSGCYSGPMRLYGGTIHTTASLLTPGFTCQRWDAQYPHTHSYQTGTFPPGETYVTASNYCRDPGNDGYLWCYTTNRLVRWDYCNIDLPSC